MEETKEDDSTLNEDDIREVIKNVGDYLFYHENCLTTMNS